jgi:Na+-transporting methylmalonyl-CoA/oxaloacetate decarboxylase gamma subunit
MKKLFISLLVVGLTATSNFAQSAFDKDASGFHKKAVMVCGTMKAQAPDAQQVANVLSAATTDIENADSKTANELYQSFSAKFPKLFIASI